MAALTHRGRRVEKELRLDAPPHDVFEAWADPEGIARWFVDRAEGRAEEGETVTWDFEPFGVRLPIAVREADPPRRLVLSGAEASGAELLQEVVLEEEEGGGTRLRLVHSGFPEDPAFDEELEGIESGWELALATLRHQLERHPGAARTHLLAMRQTSFEFVQVRPLYSTAEGLRAWLARGAKLADEPPRAGTRIDLDLGDGAALSGEVLARTEREALVSWEEEDAVLGLKSFSMGAERFVALDLSAWDLPEIRREPLQRLLDERVERLVEALRTRT